MTACRTGHTSDRRCHLLTILIAIGTAILGVARTAALPAYNRRR